MNKEMYYNEYGMMNSLYSGSVYENKNNNPFDYNPEEAIRLLKEAGYSKRNSDGWLVNDESGKCFLLRLSSKTSAYMVTPVRKCLKSMESICKLNLLITIL